MTVQTLPEWAVGIPNPERYTPGSPFSTHPWDENNPMWDRETGVWCSACGTAAWKTEAHQVCPGEPAGIVAPLSRAVLYATR